MDHFGIGAAIQGAANIYIQSARRTGRTVSLVESVKDGDRICFANRKESDRVRLLCLDRGINVECIVINPKQPELIFDRCVSRGRTLFDHSWVEQYYLAVIERSIFEIDRLEQQASGYGEAHRETHRRAEEISKWRI